MLRHEDSGVGERFVKTRAILLFNFFHLSRLQDFAAVEAFDVLGVVVFRDQLGAPVPAGWCRHCGIDIGRKSEYSTGGFWMASKAAVSSTALYTEDTPGKHSRIDKDGDCYYLSWWLAHLNEAT
jgi:hypothetical protein